MATNNLGNTNILTSGKFPLDAKQTPVNNYNELLKIRYSYVGMRVVVLNTDFQNCLPFEYEAVEVTEQNTVIGDFQQIKWKILSPAIIGTYDQLINEELFPNDAVEEGLEVTLVGTPQNTQLRKFVCISKPNNGCDKKSVWEEKSFISKNELTDIKITANGALTLIDKIAKIVDGDGVNVTFGDLLGDVSNINQQLSDINDNFTLVEYNINQLETKHDNDIQNTQTNILSIVNNNKNESDNNHKSNSDRLDAIEEKILLDGASLNTSISMSQKVRDEESTITASCSTNLSTGQTLEIISGGVVVATSSGTTATTLSYTVTGITGSISFSYQLKYGNRVIRSASRSCSAYYYIYCGFATSYENVLGHLSLRSYASGTYSATSSEDDVYYFILVPTGIGVPTNFSMGGAPYVMNNLGTKTFKGVSYTVLRSGGLYGIGGMVNISVS